MLNFFIIVSAFASGVLFTYVFFRRSTSSKRHDVLLVWTGKTFEGYPVKVVASGLELADKTIYPEGIIQYLPSAFAHFTQFQNIRLYFCAIDHVALADHKATERARLTIVLDKMFDSGGDWLNWLATGAYIVPIVVMIIFYFTFSSLSGTMARLEANQLRAYEILSKPLVTAPGEVKK